MPNCSFARSKAYSAINFAQVEANWLIGKRIVEQEQKGESRAEYGKQVITLVSGALSDALSDEFGKGYSETNIRNFRKFFLTFSDLSIQQAVPAKSDIAIQQAPPAPFYNYILKCFVLIDLKIGRITHQDVGQMDMYVRMFDDLKREKDDNPTIRIPYENNQEMDEQVRRMRLLLITV